MCSEAWVCKRCLNWTRHLAKWYAISWPLLLRHHPFIVAVMSDWINTVVLLCGVHSHGIYTSPVCVCMFICMFICICWFLAKAFLDQRYCLLCFSPPEFNFGCMACNCSDSCCRNISLSNKVYISLWPSIVVLYECPELSDNMLASYVNFITCGVIVSFGKEFVLIFWPCEFCSSAVCFIFMVNLAVLGWVV